MAISDETKADIKALVDYSTTTMQQAGDIGQHWAAPFSRASSAGAGMSGVTEALRFGHKLSGAMQAFAAFMPDVVKGGNYLGYGILAIADHYATADMNMGQEMTTVADAFMPPPAKSAATEANESEFAAQREAYFHPQKNPDGSPELPPAEQNYQTPEHMTPDQAAADHRKQYAEDETWRPVDPNAPVPVDDTYDCSAGCVPGL